jgi:hypothetical protein
MIFRALRVPERLFAAARWLVSLLFAYFLIGLGGKVVGDLPGVDQRLSVQSYMDPAQVAPLHATRDSLVRTERAAQDAHERAIQQHTVATNAYASQKASFDAWIAARTATTDPRQDPEVLSRTRALDSLKATERAAESQVEQLDATLLAINQAREANREAETLVELEARDRFEAAQFRAELRVFGIRLAITLPLLLLAGWMVARKRKSEYWPLLRGFVLFALFAFFVELVPYLPSYGGYVRYGVGIVATLIAGVYSIRAMRKYLAQRQQVEQRSEPERRRALPYDEAIKRIDGGVCPGCERAIAKSLSGLTSYCVHCGLRLFDQCTACDSKKNAFYPYCPTCGVPAQGSSAPIVAAPAPAP